MKIYNHFIKYHTQLLSKYGTSLLADFAKSLENPLNFLLLYQDYSILNFKLALIDFPEDNATLLIMISEYQFIPIF